MMRILMNGVSALRGRTGVGHTTEQLHNALVATSSDDSFWLYPGSMIRQLGGGILRKPGPSTGTGSNSRPRLIAAAKAAYRVHFRAVARWGSFELYHEPNFVPFLTPLPTVVTVHDLSVLLHPEWHPVDRVRFHEKHFRAGLGRAEQVIVVSESVRRELIEHLNLNPLRVTAIHNGIGDQYTPQPAAVVATTRHRLGLPPRYLLAVGTIEPRKNIGTLLRAFIDLPGTLRDRCPLVLAGGWGWRAEPERRLFEETARDRGVIHLGYVDDGDLPALYSGADALLYPSFYEGFGLPPVEMLACGGVAIVSTATAVREIVGGHALVLNPHDLTAWREAMRRAIVEPSSFAEYRRGGIGHARRFNWQTSAQATLALYRRVLGRETTVSDTVKRAA